MLVIALVLEGRSRKETAKSCGMDRQRLTGLGDPHQRGRAARPIGPHAARANLPPHARADNWLSLQVWEDYSATVEACGQAKNHFLAQPKGVRSVTARSWPRVHV